MKRLSKSQILLLELLLNLIFFCVCAAICMALLSRAHVLSRESASLGYAVTLAQNTAEVFKTADGDLTRVGTILGGRVDGDTLQLEYDAQGNPATEAPAFAVAVTAATDNGLQTATICVTNPHNQDPIYELSVALATQGRAQ